MLHRIYKMLQRPQEMFAQKYSLDWKLIKCILILFSDGVAAVTKSLFQIIQEIVDKRIPNEDVKGLSEQFSVCQPKTKESLYYR